MEDINNYVYIDTETTGLDPNRDEILEVAAIKFDRSGKILETFHQLCAPLTGFISEEVSKINKITMKDVKGKPYYGNIRPDLAVFIGKSILVGHNLKQFDIGFLKLQPERMEDTLEMCRAIWPGKNNLAAACRRVGIKFESDKAHSALYDVEKGVELYLVLKTMQNQSIQTDLFKPTDIKPTQVYSYSRINLFHTCPYKWKQIYLLKNKEPQRDYFIIGRTIHKIAQMSALWCYMKTFGMKFKMYVKKNSINLSVDLSKLAEASIKKGAIYSTDSVVNIGMFLYSNISYIVTFFGKTMIDFINHVNEEIKEGEYEIVDKPPEEIYQQIIQRSMVMEHCIDPEHISEVMRLADFFYKQKDFTVKAGDVALVEKQFIFDKNWKPLKDWWSDDGYMRGALDVVEYTTDDCVTITDYKSGRTMLTEEQLSNDNQMKIYTLFIHKYLPEIQTIIIKHHYIRFGKIVKIVIENVEQAAKEAELWITESISMIEAEILKPDKEAFQPNRNSFCGTCFLAESNKCPLFNVKDICDITDPCNFIIKNMDDLRKAWKKIEVNQMEIKNLTSKCKSFVKECQGRVSIDKNAILDIWVEEVSEHDALKSVSLLLKKKIDIADILKYLTMPKTILEKILRKAKVELTPEEMASISDKKTRTKFDAFTKEEIEEAGYLNK